MAAMRAGGSVASVAWIAYDAIHGNPGGLEVVFRLLVAAVCCFLAGGEVMAFDIEAHRGGRALYPENTLPSFANALSMGVDTLELDIGVTQDGTIVVSHERSLNPDLARDGHGGYVAPPGTPLIRLPLVEL